MPDSEKLEQLIECLIHVIGRVAIPQAEVIKIVNRGPKQVDAFNMCDGKYAQIEIAEKTGLDRGNLSRTINRWIEAGVVFSIGQGNEARPLHIYPISCPPSGKSKKKKSRNIKGRRR